MTEVGRWLVQMEWRQAGWSVCMPLLSSLARQKSRRRKFLLLVPPHPGHKIVVVVVCVLQIWLLLLLSTNSKSYVAHNVNCHNQAERLFKVIEVMYNKLIISWKLCKADTRFIRTNNTRDAIFQWPWVNFKVISPTAKLFKCSIL